MTENSEHKNWWGSWLNTAKTKGNEVLEFVKKDLEEFGTVVKTEASNMVTSTGAVLEKTLKLDEPESTASHMKRSFSSFLGQMNHVLNPSPDDSDTEAILITSDSETITLTKLQKAIYELQKNERTFTQDPESCLKKKYDCWLEIVDEQLSEERLTKHLTSSITLNNQYLCLVPDKVSHQTFWKRYLFRKALIEDELAHEEELQRRELKEGQINEESLQWEKEDFASDIDLTEEEQIKLLEQYEYEKKSQNPTKKSPIKSPTEVEISKPIENKPLLNCRVPKINSTTQINNDKIIENTNENHFTAVDKCLNENDKCLKLIKTDSSISLDTKSSNSSSDGDWEKINDISEK